LLIPVQFKVYFYCHSH